MWRAWPPRWSALWAGKFQPGFLCCCHGVAVAMVSMCAGDNSASRQLLEHSSRALSQVVGSLCAERKKEACSVGGSRSGPCTCVTGAAEGGAMPRNQERCMEAKGALGRGGCKARWELPPHRPVGLGSQAQVPSLASAVLCGPSLNSHFRLLSQSHCKCSPGIKYH